MGGSASIATGISCGANRGLPMPTRTDATRPSSSQLRREHAGQRLDGELAAVGLRQAAIDGVLDEAAHAVAGHLRLRAVRVVEHHAQRGDGRVAYKQQAVGANTEVAVTDRFGELMPIALDRARVDDEEVVAGSVELREAHR